MTRRKARTEADQLKIKFLQDQLAAAVLRGNELAQENLILRQGRGNWPNLDGTAYNQMGVPAYDETTDYDSTTDEWGKG